MMHHDSVQVKLSSELLDSPNEMKSRAQRNQESNVHLDILDLPGPLEHYLTPQMLLTDAISVFTVVTSYMRGNGPPQQNMVYKQELEYWLKYLKSCFPTQFKHHAVLAITHLDAYFQATRSSTIPPDLPQLQMFRDFTPPLYVNACVPVEYLSDEKMHSVQSYSNNRSLRSDSEYQLRQGILKSIASQLFERWIPRVFNQAQDHLATISQRLRQNRDQANMLVPFTFLKQQLCSQMPDLTNNSQLMRHILLYLQSMGQILLHRSWKWVVIDPAIWISKIISCLKDLSSSSQHVISSHNGLISLSNLKLRLENVMGLRGLDEVKASLEILQDLGLCSPVTSHALVASISTSTSSPDVDLNPNSEMKDDSTVDGYWMFPFLLQEASQSVRDERWPPLPRHIVLHHDFNQHDSQFNHLHFVGRRWQLKQINSQLIPPFLFAALQTKLMAKYSPVASFLDSHNRADEKSNPLQPVIANQSDVAMVHCASNLMVIHSVDRMNRALIECEPLQGLINITVRGQSPATLLGDLFELVEELLHSSPYQSLNWDRLALCPNCLRHNITSQAHSFPLQLNSNPFNPQPQATTQPRHHFHDWQLAQSDNKQSWECTKCKFNGDFVPNVILFGMATNDSTTLSNEIIQPGFDSQSSTNLEGKLISTPYIDWATEQKAKSHEIYLCHSVVGSEWLARPLSFLLPAISREFNGLPLLHTFYSEQVFHNTPNITEIYEKRNICIHQAKLAIMIVDQQLFDQSSSNQPLLELRTLLQRHGDGEVQILPVFVGGTKQEQEGWILQHGGEIGRRLLDIAHAQSLQFDQPPRPDESTQNQVWHFLCHQLIPLVLPQFGIKQHQIPSPEVLLQRMKEKYPPDFPFHNQQVKVSFE